MLIDFKNMEDTVIKNFRGGEKDTCAKMYTDDNNRIMKAVLEPGASIGFHYHDAGSEVVYILSGIGKAVYDEGEEYLEQGTCHYCPKGHSHSIINDGSEDLIFFAVVPQQ